MDTHKSIVTGPFTRQFIVAAGWKEQLRIGQSPVWTFTRDERVFVVYGISGDDCPMWSQIAEAMGITLTELHARMGAAHVAVKLLDEVAALKKTGKRYLEPVARRLGKMSSRIFEEDVHIDPIAWVMATPEKG